MNNKIRRFIEPSVRMYLVILFIFTIATFFFDARLAQIELAVLVIMLIFSAISARKKQKELVEYINSITYDVQSAKNDTLLNFPLPMVVFKMEDKQIVWGNQDFFAMFGVKSPSFQAQLPDLIPEFSDKWLKEGRSLCPGLVVINEKKYQIYGNVVRSDKGGETSGFMAITYWVDVTEYDKIRVEYENSKPVIALVVMDNVDEMTKGVTERNKNEVLTQLDEKIMQWADGKDGLVRRVNRDRYLFVFEERFLAQITEEKFSLIEDAHNIISDSGIHATISIGIGRDGSGLAENHQFASLGMEMALSRGGDQAVIKNRFTFEFFGGRGIEVETRTKVKTRVVANALTEIINDSSHILVMGHKFADLDAIGAAVGICSIARNHNKTYNIVVDPDKNVSQSLIKMLEEHEEYKNAFISPSEAMIKADGRTLLVVVDTHRPEQVEDENLLLTCNRVVVIDHHRRAATYIENPTLMMYEPNASSTSEILAELMQEIVQQTGVQKCEAEALLSGIVLDTKNFTLRTGERTFDAAAYLKRLGADTVSVKRLLQNDFEGTIEKYTILQGAKIYRESIAISIMHTSSDRIASAQAADEMLNISGVEASIVAYPTPAGGVAISARSIGKINVQVLLEHFGGGGNNSAAGAQIKDITIQDAAAQLIKAIDQYLDE